MKCPCPTGALVFVRRHGNPEGPRILFSHGCGLSADAYYPYWSLLAERFDLFIYDLRSHGWNPVSDVRAQNIPTFAQDCESVIRAIRRNYGESPVVGVFHSMSALTALLHEERSKEFSALVLFDPPIQRPGSRPEDLLEVGELMSRIIRRRQEWYESREEFAGRLLRNPAYRRLLPGVVGLIAETTLRSASGGAGYELCCPREHEALIYDYGFGWAMQVDLQKICCPVKVIGADPTERHSFMPSMDLSELTRVDYDFIPETTHFLQMEEPERCLALTLKFLKSQGLI